MLNGFDEGVRPKPDLVTGCVTACWKTSLDIANGNIGPLIDKQVEVNN